MEGEAAIPQSLLFHVQQHVPGLFEFVLPFFVAFPLRLSIIYLVFLSIVLHPLYPIIFFLSSPLSSPFIHPSIDYRYFAEQT